MSNKIPKYSIGEKEVDIVAVSNMVLDEGLYIGCHRYWERGEYLRTVEVTHKNNLFLSHIIGRGVDNKIEKAFVRAMFNVEQSRLLSVHPEDIFEDEEHKGEIVPNLTNRSHFDHMFDFETDMELVKNGASIVATVSSDGITTGNIEIPQPTAEAAIEAVTRGFFFSRRGPATIRKLPVTLFRPETIDL